MKKKTIKGGSVTTDAQKTLKIGKAPTIGGKADMPKLITTRKATSTRAPFANKEKMKPAPKARATKRGTPVAMPTRTGNRSSVPMPTKTSKDLKGTARVQSGMSAKKTPKPTVKPKPKSKMTPEDKAYNDLLNKYKGDITKIPGFKNGKGTM
jgi:hypothetical protein